jgi:caa(3)-type oxidase subunit IV
MEHSPEHSQPSLRTYYVVYGALLVLLVLTVAVAQFQLGVFGIVLALTIAIVKAVLVILYFMHLRDNSRLTWIFAGAGFVWLLLLFAFTMTDYLSRGWVGN